MVFAAWTTRAAAVLVDGLVSLPLYFIGLGIGGAIGGGKTALGLAYLLVLALGIYQLYLQGTTGATIGKRLMRIVVIEEAEQRPTGFGRSLLRSVLHVLDLTTLVGYLWPLWNGKKQTFADKIVKTVVVNAPN